MSERGLILLRTHFVDERIAEAARTYAAGGDYDVMIAVDETAGEIDALGLPKLSLSLNSCVRLGLNVAFEKPLWRCGDYLFYHALALPRHEIALVVLGINSGFETADVALITEEDILGERLVRSSALEFRGHVLVGDRG